MARVEPANMAVLLPGDDAVGLAGRRLSVAARYEEPDLFTLLQNPLADAMCDEDDPITLSVIERGDGLRRIDGASVVIALARRGSVVQPAVFCRYPLKLVRELESSASAERDPGASLPREYAALLRANDATLDPLCMAVPGMKAEFIASLQEAGESLLEAPMPTGGTIELRVVRDERQMRALLKAFEPGLFSARPDPFILDGPVGFARWKLAAGHEHMFSCLLPLGHTGASLQLNELLLHLGTRDAMANARARSAAHGGESSGRWPDAPPMAVMLPEGLRPVRHFFSTDSSREYASMEWEEDLNIESRVADCCALLVRGEDELDVVVGPRSRAPLTVQALYAPKAVHWYGSDPNRDSDEPDALEVALARRWGGGEPESKPRRGRTVVFPPERAQRLLRTGTGDVAVWPAPRDPAVLTQALLQRRPRIELRRSMVSMALHIPSLLVVSFGLH